MASTGYDLAVEDTFEVRGREGTTTVGLKRIFLSAHEFTDIQINHAPAGAGLWRVLPVIAARLTGLDEPRGAEEWFEARDSVLARAAFDANEVERYFGRHVFDLFHPTRPFLQDPRLAEQSEPAGLNKLVLERPAGRNQPWLVHHRHDLSVPITPAQAAHQLLAQLYYGPSGMCRPRTVNGTSYGNMTSGPLRSVLSFHPVGATVYQSLILSIPYPGARGTVTAAPWEQQDLPDPLSVPPAPTGVAGILTGRLRHAILLIPDTGGTKVIDAYFTWAWRQPHAEAKDPFLIYQTTQEGRLRARPASAERGLWRDLDALLLEDLGIQHSQRPLVLRNLQDVDEEILTGLRVRAFGFDQDGQTRDRQYFTSLTPKVFTLLRDPGTAAKVSRTRAAAERVQWHLDRALKTAWYAINDPKNGDGPPARSEKKIGPGPWPGAGERLYWPRAEELFWDRLRASRYEEPERDYIQIAVRAFDEVTAQVHLRPRTQRALERARGFIYHASNSPKRNS